VLIRRGRFAEAVAELDRLIEVQPANTQARLEQMSALVLAGDFDGALRRLEEALTVLPESPEIKFNLSRLLACGPDRAARDGIRAVLLARELTAAAPNLLHLETLAMALAEAGRFDEAAETQQQLVDRARGAGNQALADRLAVSLELYRRGETCDPAALGLGR
jgi:Flp pilus assembly protein TadD